MYTAFKCATVVSAVVVFRIQLYFVCLSMSGRLLNCCNCDSTTSVSPSWPPCCTACASAMGDGLSVAPGTTGGTLKNGIQIHVRVHDHVSEHEPHFRGPTREEVKQIFGSACAVLALTCSCEHEGRLHVILCKHDHT